jgi:hypothetical protein
LAVIKCATHQAGLAAKAAVIGEASKIGSSVTMAFEGAVGNRRQAAEDTIQNRLCGTASRLFKYLIPDYFEQFAKQLHMWVDRKLLICVKSTEAIIALQTDLQALCALYTHHVLPRALLTWLNKGWGQLEHVSANGVEPSDAERTAIVDEVVSVLHKHMLHVDEHPTLSRFWTFREAVDKMLLMRALGFPKEVLVHPAGKPRPQSQRRLKATHAFFDHPDCYQFLKRTSLALQLTGVLTDLTGKGTGIKVSGPSELVPPVVRLCKGEAHTLLQKSWSSIVGKLHSDKELDSGRTIGVLLGRAANMTRSVLIGIGNWSGS